MDDISHVIEKFKQSGKRLTSQRFSVFHLLRDNRNHPSAKDIYHQILNIHPNTSFTTVYNILQTLADMGEVTELTIDPTRTRYDPDTRDHYHSFCRKCRKIQDHFPDNGSHIQPDILEDHSGFNLHRINVYFQGICEKCQVSYDFQI